MKTLSKLLFGFAVLAVMAVPAQAQQGRGRGFGFGGPGLSMLLSNKSVQEELKLDGTQAEKATALAEKQREQITSATEGLEGAERFAKMREMQPKLEEETRTAMRDFLKPEQVKRLHQIQHQVQGAQALTSEYVQNHLKLTDSQKSDIQSIIEDSGQKMREIFQDAQGDREQMRTKMTELRKETLAKAEAKLTDEQKKSWKEMLGAPFEIKFEGRPGGR
jgi:type VI protein secretion system component VasK